MELEFREGFVGAEAEVGEDYGAVCGGPGDGWRRRGGRGCGRRGHCLAEGGCEEKQGGCDGESGDVWTHVGTPGACELRIAFCLRFAKRMKGPETVGFRMGDEIPPNEVNLRRFGLQRGT